MRVNFCSGVCVWENKYTQFVVIPLAMGLIAVWAGVVDKEDVGKRELLGGAMFLRHT